jgi:glycosyltransferase involved in cell wall biosynthesis
MQLSRMQKSFVISRWGTEECKKFGLDAEYLDVGIDTATWRIPSMEERDQARQMLNVQDKFVVLTVADNQERKNLSKAIEIFAEFHKRNPDSVYVLVTREKLQVGWELRDLARVMGCSDAVMIFERGMPVEKLWLMTAASDAFLLTSKAEGLGLPVLEAMATGIPVVGTDCTTIHEHLQDGRGYLIPYDFVYIDPFMNGNRYFMNTQKAVEALEEIKRCEGMDHLCEMTDRAMKYVQTRNWDRTIEQFNKSIIELIGGTDEQTA